MFDFILKVVLHCKYSAIFYRTTHNAMPASVITTKGNRTLKGVFSLVDNKLIVIIMIIPIAKQKLLILTCLRATHPRG